MKEELFRNKSTIWSLATGMIIVMFFFFSVFRENRLRAEMDDFGDYHLVEVEEEYTGYEGLMVDRYQGFFRIIIFSFLILTFIIMVMNVIQLTGTRDVSLLCEAFSGLLVGLSFFLLILFSWIGWVMEVLILINFGQTLYAVRKKAVSFFGRIIRVTILILLIVLIPVSQSVSWYFFSILE